MKKYIIFLLLIFSISILASTFIGCSQTDVSDYIEVQTANYVPDEGYVPDAETAVKIAEAVWLPIYGKEIYDEKPFVASLKNGVWKVKGTLQQVPGADILGGVAEIEISKKDGRILRVIHGK